LAGKGKRKPATDGAARKPAAKKTAAKKTKANYSKLDEQGSVSVKTHAVFFDVVRRLSTSIERSDGEKDAYWSNDNIYNDHCSGRKCKCTDASRTLF